MGRWMDWQLYLGVDGPVNAHEIEDWADQSMDRCINRPKAQPDWDGKATRSLGMGWAGGWWMWPRQLTQLKASTPKLTGAWWAATGIPGSPRGKFPSLAVPCPLHPSSTEDSLTPRNCLLPISRMPRPTQPARVS